MRGRPRKPFPRIDTDHPQISVDKNGCWLWAGALTTSGYGQFTRDGDYYRTHKVAWEQHRHPIPEGKWVLHRCHIRNCCNPKHLYIGTRQDNVSDMLMAGRAASKLSEIDVAVMRGLHSVGHNFKELGDMFKVDPYTVSRAVRKKTWRHV
jgi:hypothetical protein